MIKELKLIDWKSFSESTLYIDPLTILIGSNASGKSNALDAFLFLNRVSSGVGIFQAIAGDLNLPALRGGLEWVCRKPEKIFGLEVIVEGEDQGTDYKYTLLVKVNGTKADIIHETLIQLSKIEGNLEEKTIFLTELEEDDSPGINALYSTENNIVRTLADEFGWKIFPVTRTHSVLSQSETIFLDASIMQSIKLVLAQLKKIFVFDPIPSHMRGYTSLAEKLLPDGSNVAGVLAGLEKQRKSEVENILTEYLKDLPERDIKRIWTEPVGKFGTDAMLYCEEGWENLPTHEIDARGMSDGTLRYLAIVTALLTREEGSLLIIEEVDNGLHPSRATTLLNMLKTLGRKRNIDVLVTTHNSALLDAAGFSMVPFITVAHRDEKLGVSKLTQLEDISQLPKLMASGPLGRLSTEGRIESALKKESDN